MDRKIIFTAIAAFALAGCEKFTEGTINYVDFPEHDPQISANFIVSDVATEVKAYISKSAGISDTAGPQVINDAIITVKDSQENILFNLTAEDFDGEFYTLPLSSPVEIPSGIISLEVDVPEFELATATTSMPISAQVEVEFQLAADTSSMWGFEYVRDLYKLDFVNNLDADEAYLIFVESKFLDEYTGEVSDWQPMWVESNMDARITDIWLNGGILVTDETVRNEVNGLQEIFFYTPNEDEYITIVERRIRIESLSDELKRFYVSLQEYEDGQYALFAEPDLIYSNVSTGFGCFGMYRYQIIEL